MEDAAGRVEASLGCVHLVCNNAGVGVRGPLDQATYDDWDWVMGVNLGGVVNGIQTFLGRMKAHGEGGHFVNTSSMAGLLADPSMGIYSATKFAVVGLSESLRANCAFSTLSGLLFTFGAGTVADAIGLADARILMAVGLGLLGFAAFLATVSSRPVLDLPTAMHVIWADLAWVVATVPVVLMDVLSSTGAVAAIAVADVVLLLALLQYLGVRRIRGATPVPAPTAG